MVLVCDKLCAIECGVEGAVVKWRGWAPEENTCSGLIQFKVSGKVFADIPGPLEVNQGPRGEDRAFVQGEV